MASDRKNVEGLQLLPNKPGVYKFYNHQYTLLYVGKAKNLKKRVGSYFTKSHQNRKTHKLVSEINKVEFTIANSEFDAFLLENNLIKENQPKYNILLKDDKTFPFICVVKERFPRIISTRKVIKSYGTYYGPYTSVVAMKNVLDLIRKLYTIRTCKYNLSEKNIKAEKFKVCLEYHIGNCLGPCEGLQTEQEYLDEITQAEQILTTFLQREAELFVAHIPQFGNFHLSVEPLRRGAGSWRPGRPEAAKQSSISSVV